MKKILIIFSIILVGMACKKDNPVPKKAFEDISYEDIKAFEGKFSSNLLVVGKSDGTGPQIGAIIFFKTQNGLLGKLKLINISTLSPHNLICDFVNYNADGSGILLNKSDIIIQDTYHVDLDNGVQTTMQPLSDFGWNQQGVPDGYSIKPYNNAKFYLYAN